MGREEIEVSHLEYGYDKILYVEAKPAGVNNLKMVIHCYKLVSNVDGKLEESSLSCLGIDVQEVILTAPLGCGWKQLPISYLGLPFGGNSELLEFLQFKRKLVS